MPCHFSAAAAKIYVCLLAFPVLYDMVALGAGPAISPHLQPRNFLTDLHPQLCTDRWPVMPTPAFPPHLQPSLFFIHLCFQACMTRGPRCMPYNSSTPARDLAKVARPKFQIISLKSISSSPVTRLKCTNSNRTRVALSRVRNLISRRFTATERLPL
jgi:hypothetical protein